MENFGHFFTDFVQFWSNFVIDNLELVLKTSIQVSRVGLCQAENMANFSLRLS